MSWLGGGNKEGKISHEDILKSTLPDGYTPIASLHSHPSNKKGKPAIYPKGKHIVKMGPETHFSDGDGADFGYAHAQSRIIGVVTPDKSMEVGIPTGGGYKNWSQLNPGSHKYHDSSSYFNDNIILKKP